MIEFEDPKPIATAAQYRAALLALRDSDIGITPIELEMLRAHYHAPAHTITTTQLANKVGFISFSLANLQYGKLAHRIANELKYWPGSDEESVFHWWRTIAYGKEPLSSEEMQHYQWVMRPELAEILEKMRWI